ncbi:MAG: cell division protein FtsX [Candidatus Dojkabacteria bacterium]
MFSRILTNTKKQIQRSGFAGWGSLSVMTLAFLVACIFAGLAYFSNLWIQYIESRSNVLVFFDVGMDTQVINNLKDKWKDIPTIKSLGFTSEEEAYKIYGDYSSKVQPVQFDALKTNQFISGKLPSSIDIQIYSLSDLADLQKVIQKDVQEANSTLVINNTDNPTAPTTYKYASDPSSPPITLRVDSESLEKLRVVLSFLRIAGIIIIGLLFVVIFFFTFMTVEFRLYNQIEEIGVMQLVGGSLLFIRSPYILEGGFYGVIGALISTLLIGSTLVLLFVFNIQPVISQFFFENFARLPWPVISPLGWIAVIGSIAFSGFLLGASSTWFSIKRYIR